MNGPTERNDVDAIVEAQTDDSPTDHLSPKIQLIIADIQVGRATYWVILPAVVASEIVAFFNTTMTLGALMAYPVCALLTMAWSAWLMMRARSNFRKLQAAVDNSGDPNISMIKEEGRFILVDGDGRLRATDRRAFLGLFGYHRLISNCHGHSAETPECETPDSPVAPTVRPLRRMWPSGTRGPDEAHIQLQAYCLAKNLPYPFRPALLWQLMTKDPSAGVILSDQDMADLFNLLKASGE